MDIKVSDYKIQDNKFKKESSQVKAAKTPTVEYANKQINTIPSKFFKGAYGVIPFKAHSPDRSSHNISFGTNPLYSIKLKKLIGPEKYETINAKFSELAADSIDDILAICKVNDNWPRIGKTQYSGLISENFTQGKEPERAHFVIETVDAAKELANRITCLVETTHPTKVLNKDVFKIHFIQASPDIVNIKPSPIKGSGELSLYGAVRLANENGFKRIQLDSSNDSFYEAMGFKRAGNMYDVCEFENEGGIYRLSSRKFGQFLKKIENKYDIK